MPPRRQLLTLALLACALFLRAWVPVGWMPAAHGGPLAVEPCPSADPAPMMHMTGAAGHHHDDGKAGFDCFASMLAGAALPDDPLEFAAPAVEPLDLPTTSAPSAFRSTPPALPPPSTGPPTLA